VTAERLRLLGGILTDQARIFAFHAAPSLRSDGMARAHLFNADAAPERIVTFK